MSIKIMTEVWESSEYKGNRLLLLLAIADYADEYGAAFPGQETLVKKTRESLSTVKRAIKDLEKARELYVHRTVGSHNHYVILSGCTKSQGIRRLLIFRKRRRLNRAKFKESYLVFNPGQIDTGVRLTPHPGHSYDPPPRSALTSDPSITVIDPSKDSAAADADGGPLSKNKSPEKPGPKFRVGFFVLHGIDVYTVTEVNLVDAPPVDPYWVYWLEPDPEGYPISDPISSATGDMLNANTLHNHVMNAIVAAYNWNPHDIAEKVWGKIRTASKDLREVDVGPYDVKALYDFTKKTLPTGSAFGPTALVNQVPEWRKPDDAIKYIDGQTQEEVDAGVAATLAQYSTDAGGEAQDVYHSIMEDDSDV